MHKLTLKYTEHKNCEYSEREHCDARDSWDDQVLCPARCYIGNRKCLIGHHVLLLDNNGNMSRDFAIQSNQCPVLVLIISTPKRAHCIDDVHYIA